MKTTKKRKDFFCLPNPQNPWEEVKNAGNRKEFFEKEKGKEIQKSKEKRRLGKHRTK